MRTVNDTYTNISSESIPFSVKLLSNIALFHRLCNRHTIFKPTNNALLKDISVFNVSLIYLYLCEILLELGIDFVYIII